MPNAKKKPLTVAAVELRTWMKVQETTALNFALLCRVSENTVMKWRNGYTVPMDGARLAIAEVTNGAVRPGDWSVRYDG